MLQPWQAQHRDRPEARRRRRDRRAPAREGRRRAAQHALPRRRQARHRLRVARGERFPRLSTATHTRGFEHGPREALPGNDQTGACLTGVEFEDGGCHRGGRPLWSLTNMGDTGNGFLAAIAICQALYEREKTGRGQWCETAIVNAQMFNASYAVVKPDGTPFPRPLLDGMQIGYFGSRRPALSDGLTSGSASRS
ncbi:MAG: CoA transferase [Myxococcota bacterium]